MHKGKLPRLGSGILAAILILAGAVNLKGAASVDTPPAAGRADLIKIDAAKTFGSLERSPVAFLHSQHTEALAKQGKDCLTCHLEKDGRLSPKFKRLQDTGRQQVMDIYHQNCIACHIDTAGSQEKSGPITCGECHREKSPLVSTWQPIGFDKSLHFRHAKANENKCETCHHEYDEKAKKLFYAKGKEGSCRYCHGQVSQENRSSMQLASHDQCISCHRQRLAKKLSAGPADCLGCHDAIAQQRIEKVAEVPRMARNQPDVVMITALPKNNGAPVADALSDRMFQVPFDHKAHENYNESCQICHHASLTACNSCHSLQGKKEGKQIRLSSAMHQVDSEKSCIGCHNLRQQQPQCAGCHNSIKASFKPEDAACKTCHMELPPGTKPMDLQNANLATPLAATLLAERKPMRETYAVEEIPEKVVIKKLVDQYQPVELPHRKIVQTLARNIQNDPLAGQFHTDRGTLCQGCHHYSPPNPKPPACANCHGEPFDASNPFRPGLMGAYHQQCLQCHAKMGIAKPEARDCTACHPKKKG
jgi:mono/diheme cytochrome c family protein